MNFSVSLVPCYEKRTAQANNELLSLSELAQETVKTFGKNKQATKQKQQPTNQPTKKQTATTTKN